jgi:peptidoglycan hydrolase CwlO-like protein
MKQPFLRVTLVILVSVALMTVLTAPLSGEQTGPTPKKVEPKIETPAQEDLSDDIASLASETAALKEKVSALESEMGNIESKLKDLDRKIERYRMEYP